MTMIVACGGVLGSTLIGRQRSDSVPPGEAPEAPAAGSAGAVPEAPQTVARAQSDPAEGRRQDEPWFEPLLEFAQETLGALQGDRLRLVIAQKLPALLG